MKKLIFKNLVLLAQQECAPCVDAADAVAASVSSLMGRNADPYRAYVWMGMASAAAAACILIAATLLWQSSSDSVSEVITYVSWVIQ
ncbi:MAG: hypothetical protein L0Y36_10275 [Planctomycetales bacterium]|nr:hypothetical protein [Planctomycetales bacterium]